MVMMMSNIMSKKDKQRLINLINKTKLNNENQIWDLAVELERVSVGLRAKILRLHEFDDTE